MVITLFGGSFNPPHLGHLFVIQDFLESGLTDELWLLPNNVHNFGKQTIDGKHRIEMCEILIDSIASMPHCNIAAKKLRLCPIEFDLNLSGRTFDTISKLNTNHTYLKEKMFPNYPLPFIHYQFLIGSDQLPHFQKWHKAEELLKSTPFFVYPRANHPLEPLLPGMKPFTTPTQTITNISSTQIRTRLQEGKSITHLAPSGIIGYVEKYHIYQ